MEMSVSKRNSRVNFKAFNQAKINLLLLKQTKNNNEIQTKVVAIVNQEQIKA
jgi:hypothetical protein